MSKVSIAQKNDLLRTTMIGCKVILTEGVSLSPNREVIIGAVRSFNQFDEDNDPHGEHDFGAFTVNRVKYFFKFDYYDENFEFFKEDGNRVLTIMKADEY